MGDFYTKVQEAAEAVKGIANNPEICIFLDTAYDLLANEIEDIDFFNCSEIPNFPQNLSQSYMNNIILGYMQGKRIICVETKINDLNNYYKESIIFGVNLLSRLKVKTLIVINASNALNDGFSYGDLVLIKEHVLKKYGLFDEEFLNMIKMVADVLEINLKFGTYGDIIVPEKDIFNTIEKLNNMGADLYGIPTIFEINSAVDNGLKVLEISHIDDILDLLCEAGEEFHNEPISVKNNVVRLLKEIISVI